MAKEICISSTPHETRLAILEDDQLSEIYYERENEYTLAGSVYKGRVTRVLPGMQSAFVDIGLERDAFLYVTDFLEMEDPEDTDEVERAASQGDTRPVQLASPVATETPNQGGRPPREGGRNGRNGRDGRDSRGGRGEQRPVTVDGEPQGVFAPASFGLDVTETSAGPLEFDAVIPASVADATARVDETEEQGARRLRGRRRRRGGRGRDEAGQTAAAAPVEESVSEELEEEEIAPLEFEAAASRPAAPEWSAPKPVQEARSGAPTPFLLPGESLSKYGVNAAPKAPKMQLVLSELPPDTSDPLPERTSAKPSTLIEDEIVWDGKGLMPGESIAKHRRTEAVPTPTTPAAELVAAEPEVEAVEAVEEAAVDAAEPTVVFEEEEFVEEVVPAEAPEPTPASEAAAEPAVAAHVAPGPAGHVDSAVADETEEVEEHATGEASHNVDPLPPSSFRLKDLFGRKKEEEAAPEPPAPKTVPHVSAYSPGAGLVEEETIDEEEYDFHPLKAHHGDEHDLEELEEETLQQQIRSGALGEMLQEAHLDHRILISSEDDEDEDEAAGGQVVAAPGTGREGRGGRDGRGGGRDGRGGRDSRDGRGRRDGREGRGEGRSSSGGDGRRPSGGMSRRSAQTSDLPIISDLLKPGQEILVQIAKEPIAKKGARITSHIALPGRFLVFMPTVSHVGVSRKIDSDEERQRLKRILVSEKADATGGFIVRTAAEGASEEELRSDLRFLINLWNDIKQRADSSKPPALIYHDLNLIERILRDQVSDNFSHIWVDSEADYERIVRFLNRFSPELVRRVKLYTKEVPLFEHFGIQDEISKALRSKVWLKSGGSIVINQTEALVAIDINTGKYVGKTARLEDTIVKTNLDAIPEIVRQIRLRDLGGIIIIDFIDMDERKNRTRVMAALEEALKQDRAPTKVLQFNDFGLVAITRKRVKQSLERTLSVPCPVCQATGMVKSPATVANEIFIEMRKMRKHFDGSEVLLRVNPETVKVLKQNNARWLTELEDLTGKNVLIKSDATLHPEQFDIQG